MMSIGCMKERGIDGSSNLTINIEEISLALVVSLDQGVIKMQRVNTN